MTKWWNYNIFVQMFYSYFRFTGRHFLGCSLLMLAVILRNQEGIKIQLQKKNCIEEFVWGTSLLSMSLFIAFFVYSLPLSKWRTCWIKIHNIAIEGILSDDIMSKLSKIWKSLKYLGNLIYNWLAPLRTWYILDFVLTSVVPAMTLLH